MAKLLKDILKGVKSSTKVTNDLGGYKPKAGDEEEFAKKHEIEKHADRVGNGDDVYNSNVKHALNNSKEKHHGYKKPEDARVNESKKAEDAQCNRTPKGTACPLHGIAECMSVKPLKELTNKTLAGYVQGATRDALSKQYSLGKGEKVDTRKLMNRRKGIDKAVDKMANEEAEQIDELSTDLLHRAAHKAAKVAMTDVQGRSGPIFKKRAAQANKFRAKGMEQEKKERAAKAVKEDIEQIDELSPATMKSYVKKAGADKRDSEMKSKVYSSLANTLQSQSPKDANDVRAKGHDHYANAKKRGEGIKLAKKKLGEETIDEVLTKSTSAGETISDFVHSDNPKFAGKSKEKRKEMALAAYYAKQREQNEDLAVPLLGGDHPPRGESEEAIEMVKAELKALANKAMHLVMQMPAGMHVEPWCQSKIAQAKSYISDVHDYMIFGDHEKEKEDEQMDTPITLPNMSVDVNTGRNV